MEHYLKVRDTDFAKAAQKQAQYPSATHSAAPHCAPTINENPLFLRQILQNNGF